MSTRHQVYLIPGFFGFSTLGGLSYFRQIRETLADVFIRRGCAVEIIDVKTLPTASLRHRARKLLMTVEEHGGHLPGVHVHFVGHSTGALDARMAASPGTDLDLEFQRDVIANLRTIVSIAGAHYGTPLANFFTTVYGKNLLYLVTLLIIVGLWRRPIIAIGSLMGVLGKINNLLGLDETIVHQLTNQLLKDFTPTARDEVRAFLRSVLEDQGVIIQLTPEGMDLFNAAVQDDPDVRYVSYATAAPAPTKIIKNITLRHALTPLNKVLYSLLWTLTSRSHAGYPYHPPIAPTDVITGRPLPFPISERTSDGVVPTLSQIWGEFRGVVRADHLDVLGHYLRGPFDVRDGADWFGSGAKFDRDAFEWLWEDIAGVLLESTALLEAGEQE
jgi:pimeloyl-ACP methyl ester carboxylesterase